MYFDDSTLLLPRAAKSRSPVVFNVATSDFADLKFSDSANLRRGARRINMFYPNSLALQKMTNVKPNGIAGGNLIEKNLAGLWS